jgi:hypothetical protein
VSKGPLAVRFGAWPHVAPQAGAVEHVHLQVENTGSVAWRDGMGISVAYHWLDGRGNPIVWDGLRTPAPRLDPGAAEAVEVRVRAPIPPGGYRLAFDMVAENRAWFSELGSEQLVRDVVVAPRGGEPRIDLPDWVVPAEDWADRVEAAHAEGYAVVAGAIEWESFHRPRALAPYIPGPGRMPSFAAPLLCPSVLPGVELEPLEAVLGLPAFAPPRGEPWVYDGRIVLTARPRSGRRPT